jgi:hypothetical protein
VNDVHLQHRTHHRTNRKLAPNRVFADVCEWCFTHPAQRAATSRRRTRACDPREADVRSRLLCDGGVPWHDRHRYPAPAGFEYGHAEVNERACTRHRQREEELMVWPEPAALLAAVLQDDAEARRPLWCQGR